MSDVRKVVGVFGENVGTRDGIEFPLVLAWIRGRNTYETKNLRRHFPTRGTVFLHVSACNNQRPEPHQVGLFNCVESPGESAEWEVDSTSGHLAKVIEYAGWGKNPDPLAFSQWLIAQHDTPPCNILRGSGQVYVTRGKRELVGPFVAGPDGKLTARGQSYLYEEVDPIGFEIVGRRHVFIDTELLPKGKPLTVDPRDAIHRRLKLASQAEKMNWLSRDKVRDLSAALAAVAIEDGSEWIMADLSRALEVLSLGGGIDEKFTKACLELVAVAKAIEVQWKERHAEEVKKAKEEIAAFEKAADNIKLSVDGLNREAGQLRGGVERLNVEKTGLENTMLELQGKIEKAKLEAQHAFEAELKRIAQLPANLALLGAWIGGGNKPADRSQPLIRVQRPGSERQQAADLNVALFNNLKTCGLSPIVATELTAVCRAALVAGQPISFRSLFADLLAEVVAAAVGLPAMVWADVPAGLLDPVDWDGLIPGDQRGCPIILQNANRSDVQLVLGTLHPALLRRALGHQKPDRVVLLTLETNTQMLVSSEFPFGPLIDERVLRFNPGSATTNLTVITDFAKQLPEVSAVSAEEFSEIGDSLRRLPLFASSAQGIVFRRAYGALRGVCESEQDVRRLFFKYWCLPRCLPEDAKAVLEAHKDSWGKDKILVELREALDHNG